MVANSPGLTQSLRVSAWNIRTPSLVLKRAHCRKKYVSNFPFPLSVIVTQNLTRFNTNRFVTEESLSQSQTHSPHEANNSIFVDDCCWCHESPWTAHVSNATFRFLFITTAMIVTATCNVLISADQKYSKIQISWGSAQNPTGVAYSTPPDTLAGGEGASCPLPKNPTLPFGSHF